MVIGASQSHRHQQPHQQPGNEATQPVYHDENLTHSLHSQVPEVVVETIFFFLSIFIFLCNINELM